MAKVAIRAPMYGTLAVLHAAEGSDVAEGERIADIEAMKNFYSVESPDVGTLHWDLRLGEITGEGEIIGWIDTAPRKTGE